MNDTSMAKSMMGGDEPHSVRSGGFTIFHKFLVVSVATTLLAMFAYSFLVMREAQRMLKESLERRGVTFASYLSRIISFPLSVGDDQMVRELLEHFGEDDDVCFCVVYLLEPSAKSAGGDDGGGDAPGASGAGLLSEVASTGTTPPTRETRLLGESLLGGGGEPFLLSWRHPHVLEILSPVYVTVPSASVESELYGGENALSTGESRRMCGLLHLGLSTMRMESLMELQVSRFGWIALFAITIAVAFSYVMSRLVVRPIERLQEMVRRFAEEGRAEPVVFCSSDEIGEFARVFNTMLARLERSMRFNAAVTTNMPLGVAVVDDEGGIAGSNELFMRMLELSPHDRGIEGDRREGVSPAARHLCEEILSYVKSRAPGGEDARPHRRTLQVDLDDGTRLHYTLRFVPLEEWTDASCGAWLVLIEDMTQEREMERRLAEAGKLIYLGQMASGIAHEFNNIIQIILNFASLLAEPLPGDKHHTCVRKIVENARRAARIAESLLTYARPGRGKKEDENLLDLASEVLFLCRTSMKQQTNRVEFSVKACSPPERLVSRCDKEQILLVLLNLCKNAIHAVRGEGKVEVRLTRRRATPADVSPADSSLDGRSIREGDEVVEIAVSDDGVGIPPEHMDKLFAPFFSTKGVYADNEEDRRYTGTGLGLATCYSLICRVHGGNITVESKPGEGSTFRILLPASDVVVPPRDDDGTGAAVFEFTHPTASGGGRADSGGTEGAACAPNGRRILLVDDEDEFLFSIANWLEQHGVGVALALNAADAMDIAMRERDSLLAIFTDHYMPGKDGIALIEELRRRGVRIPMYLLSANVLTLEERAMEAGADGCLAKPVSPEDLLKVIVELETASHPSEESPSQSIHVV